MMRRSGHLQARLAVAAITLGLTLAASPASAQDLQSDPAAVRAVIEAVGQDANLFGLPGGIHQTVGHAATGHSRVSNSEHPGVCEQQIINLIATPSPAPGVPGNVRAHSRMTFGFMGSPNATQDSLRSQSDWVAEDLACYRWAEDGGYVGTEADDVHMALAGAQSLLALAEDAAGSRSTEWSCEDGSGCPGPDEAAPLLRLDRLSHVWSDGGPDTDHWTLVLYLNGDDDADWTVTLAPNPAGGYRSPTARWSATPGP